MAPNGAVKTSRSIASVEKITAVYDIKVESFSSFTSFSSLTPEMTQLWTADFTIDVPEKEEPKLRLGYCIGFNREGSFYLYLCHLKKEKLPIVVSSHVMKNETKVRSSSTKKLVLAFDTDDDHCELLQRHIITNAGWQYVDSILKPEIDSRIGELLGEDGSLTLRLEISILSCCLSTNGGKRKAYEGFIEESEEKKIRTAALDSLGKDVASMKRNGIAFSDLDIICQGKRFKVHKAFLSARSEVRPTNTLPCLVELGKQ